MTDKDISKLPIEEQLAHYKSALSVEQAAHAKTQQEAAEIVSKAQEHVADANEQVERKAILVTFEKKKYAVKAKSFRFKNVDYKAEDLKGNEDLIEKLIKSGSSILSLVK